MTTEPASPDLVQCPACGGQGTRREVIGYVTADMASDACEPGMEGAPMEGDVPCSVCGGDGLLPVVPATVFSGGVSPVDDATAVDWGEPGWRVVNGAAGKVFAGSDPAALLEAMATWGGFWEVLARPGDGSGAGPFGLTCPECGNLLYEVEGATQNLPGRSRCGTCVAKAQGHLPRHEPRIVNSLGGTHCGVCGADLNEGGCVEVKAADEPGVAPHPEENCVDSECALHPTEPSTHDTSPEPKRGMVINTAMGLPGERGVPDEPRPGLEEMVHNTAGGDVEAAVVGPKRPIDKNSNEYRVGFLDGAAYARKTDSWCGEASPHEGHSWAAQLGEPEAASRTCETRWCPGVAAGASATPGPFRNGREHELKCWPQFFEAIEEGRKRYEVRHNDRDYRYGDTLHLREWDPKDEAYTGRTMRVVVTYLMQGQQSEVLKDLPRSLVVMSIWPERPAVTEGDGS